MAVSVCLEGLPFIVLTWCPASKHATHQYMYIFSQGLLVKLKSIQNCMYVEPTQQLCTPSLRHMNHICHKQFFKIWICSSTKGLKYFSVLPLSQHLLPTVHLFPECSYPQCISSKDASLTVHLFSACFIHSASLPRMLPPTVHHFPAYFIHSTPLYLPSMLQPQCISSQHALSIVHQLFPSCHVRSAFLPSTLRPQCTSYKHILFAMHLFQARFIHSASLPSMHHPQCTCKSVSSMVHLFQSVVHPQCISLPACSVAVHLLPSMLQSTYFPIIQC